MFYVSIFLLLLLILLSIFGNLLVIFAALVNKRLRKYTHLLIVNLAISDLLISSFSLTLRIIRLSESRGLIHVPNTTAFCKFTTCVTITLFAASNLNLLLLTFDRYCAVNHALAYKFSFKRIHKTILVSTSLIAAIIVGMLPSVVSGIGQTTFAESGDSACTFASVIDPSYNIFVNMFTFFGPLFLMIALYVSIIRKVRSSYNVYKDSKAIRSSLTREVIKRRERQMSLGILFLLGAHTILLAPISVLDFVQIFGGIKPPTLAINVCLFLTYTNPVVNAPTYAAASKEYYPTFTNLLCCFGRLRRFVKACTKFKNKDETSLTQQVRIRRTKNDIWYITVVHPESRVQ